MFSKNAMVSQPLSTTGDLVLNRLSAGSGPYAPAYLFRGSELIATIAESSTVTVTATVGEVLTLTANPKARAANPTGGYFTFHEDQSFNVTMEQTVPGDEIYCLGEAEVTVIKVPALLTFSMS